MTWLAVLVGVACIVGIVGSVVPVLPGPLLACAAVAVWGAFEGGWLGWSLAVSAAALLALATVIKYLLPAKWMREGGVPAAVMVAGGVAGIIGFFVVPVVGLILGFVLGVFLAEWVRVRSPQQAWPTTVTAMKAAGLSVLVDLAASVLVTAGWVAVLVGSAVT